MCLLYEYRLGSGKKSLIRGEFHYYDSGNNGHHIQVTRRIGRSSIERWNTADECYAQLLGLSVLQLGHDSMLTESNHHRFHFWRSDRGVHLLCHTTVPGDFKEDEIVLKPDELPKLIAGYGRSILNSNPPSEAKRLPMLRKKVEDMRKQLLMLT